ncbi:MAG: phytase [Flavobacteriales bacterium]|nr:phytase [Flavobacteriales bacterium]
MKEFTTFLFGLMVLSAFAQEPIMPLLETDPVLNNNGADDPAIWLHPVWPDSSFFVGTDKSANGRLELYNMDGSRFDATPQGIEYNNVDVMYNYVLNGDTIDLVGACNKPATSLDFFRIDPDTRSLINITGNTDVGMSDMYGFTMYSDLCNNEFYSFLSRRTTHGKCYQYRMINTPEGLIDIELVRTLEDLPTRTEGMVADPVLNYFYVCEESVGIWKYGARPEDGQDRVLMDSTSGPYLTSLLEGLCIYYTGDSTGYLMVSSQGASDFQVYRREGDNEYLGTFEFVDNDELGVDGVYHADGIDVLNMPMGNLYPNGVFITHDTSNDVGYSNFKTVPWDSIALALGLEITPEVDRRLIGFGLCDTLVTDTNTVDTNTVDTTVFVFSTGLLHLRLFPNPVSYTLTIDGLPADQLNAEVLIQSAQGQVIWRERLDNGVVDVTELPAGMYILQVEGTALRFIKK